MKYACAPCLCSASLALLLVSCGKKEKQLLQPTDTQVVVEEVESTAPSVQEPLSFNEDVQPILSEYCYHCHGPDSSSRKPDKDPLRLDRAQYAFAKRENGKAVIIPGKPEESELVRLIKSKDINEIMPPPEGHKTMNAEQIAILERWVKEGAEYQEHWAFIAPKKAKAPDAVAGWAKNAIDPFVFAKMEQAGLKPNPEQNRARLFRRLKLDLTGLPPTPEEVEQFVSDKRDTDTVLLEATNRLLHSSDYAEHMARHWLDAARYGDTHGIHFDNFRLIWPYRDWVLDAFKQNMPFDQFTIDQLAGDMLPNPTLEQMIATGFNRCLPTSGEGGAIEEEYLAISAQDRVDTTAAIWLGLTTNCASCHDHKFDPLSTKENYQLAAFFRNTTATGLDGNRGDHPPYIFAPSRKDAPRWKDILKSLKKTEEQLVNHLSSHSQHFDDWFNKEREDSKNGQVHTETQKPILSLPLNKQTEQTVAQTGQTYKIHNKFKWVNGLTDQALQFDPNGYVDIGDIGNFERDQPFSVSTWLRLDYDDDLQACIISRMNHPNQLRGWDLMCERGGHVAFSLVHAWPKNFLMASTTSKLPRNQWVHICMTYDGSSKANGVQIYFNGIPQKLRFDSDSLNGTTLGKTATASTLKLGTRDGGRWLLTNGALQYVQLYDHKLNSAEVNHLVKDQGVNQLVRLSRKQLKPQQLELLQNYYFVHFDVDYQKLLQKLQELQQEGAKIKLSGSSTLIMEEKKGDPFAHILIRGQYADKGEKVSPNTPAILPPMLENQPKNRLGLAQWIVDKRNPLTARVTVNRFWYYFFGRGIVESTEDFGIMGTRPTHPELLDWLAVDFMEHDWDLHHLIRTIVTSATYRQNAIADAKKLKIDPLNKLLSRGPRYRLDAEQIRDLALFGSGLMNHHYGGPSVKPYQPKGVWKAVAMPRSNTSKYQQDTGANLYRRSLYTFVKRTAINPSMELFNAPSREVFCVRRDITNTPLQAFVTMNDPQFVEASRALAQRALQHSKTFDNRVDFLAQTLVSRNFNTKEKAVLKISLNKALEHYGKNQAEAQKLITIGASKPDAALAAAELASWTILASQVLNLDETLNK